MSAQGYFILTAAQRSTATAFNTSQVAINARVVDGASPGTGLNLNANAAGVALGASVALVGKFVAPKRIADDPEYQERAPGMVAFLLSLPWATLESDTIFARQAAP